MRPGTAAGLLAVATGVVVLIAAVGVRRRPAPPGILKVACLEGSVWQDVSVKCEGATYQLARKEGMQDFASTQSSGPSATQQPPIG